MVSAIANLLSKEYPGDSYNDSYNAGGCAARIWHDVFVDNLSPRESVVEALEAYCIVDTDLEDAEIIDAITDSVLSLAG